MVEVNISRPSLSMEMETDAVRAAGAQLLATGDDFAAKVGATLARITVNEAGIGTNRNAQAFRASYDGTAAQLKLSATEGVPKTFEMFGDNAVGEADRYEQVDREYQAA